MLPSATHIPTFLTATPATDTPQQPSLTSIEQARAGVVRIEGTDWNSGSGFIVDSDGYILTNEHVIEGPAPSNRRIRQRRSIDRTRHRIRCNPRHRLAQRSPQHRGSLTVLPFATVSTRGRRGDRTRLPARRSDLRGSMTITKGIVSAFRSMRGISLTSKPTPPSILETAADRC